MKEKQPSANKRITIGRGALCIADATQRPLQRLQFVREKELNDSGPQAYVEAQAALAGEAFAELAQRLWTLPALRSTPAVHR